NGHVRQGFERFRFVVPIVKWRQTESGCPLGGVGKYSDRIRFSDVNQIPTLGVNGGLTLNKLRQKGSHRLLKRVFELIQKCFPLRGFDQQSQTDGGLYGGGRLHAGATR